MNDVPLTRRCPVCGQRFESDEVSCPNDGKPLGPSSLHNAVLGQYQLVRRLGQGGMGTVYRAVHRKIDRTVAIKVLNRALASDAVLVNRFFYEARAANSVKHPNIVEVYDFVQQADDVYFVMEYLRGSDLHDTLHGGEISRPLEPGRAVGILLQVCAALHVAHFRNIIHRDLKPENIFLTERDGEPDFVKVFDFGIAKLERSGKATAQGTVLGTPEYIAPEQARGRSADARCDIYSLGCIAYEMLTARQIFAGGTAAEVLVRQVTWMPPALRQFVPSIPEALEAAVMAALQKDAARRPPTMLAFAESLAAAVGRNAGESASFRAAVRSTSRLSNTPTPTPVPVLTPLVLRTRPWWTRPGLMVPLGLGLLIIGAVLALSPYPGRRPAAITSPSAGAVSAPSPAPARGAVTAGRVSVTLQSVPVDAEVADEQGQVLGRTPFAITMQRGRSCTVTFRKPGYRPVQRSVLVEADITLAVELQRDRESTPRARTSPKVAKRGSKLDSVAGTIDPFRKK